MYCNVSCLPNIYKWVCEGGRGVGRGVGIGRGMWVKKDIYIKVLSTGDVCLF